MVDRRETDRTRQARYRAQRAARGEKRSDRKPSSFDAGRFVAVDGEGFNSGEEMVRVVGADNREYRYHEHHYALLKASDGSEVYESDGRLSSKTCLDFLLAIKESEKDAILVCFGAGYDMCHMLAFGLERDAIETLLHDDPGKPFARKIADVTLCGDDGTSHDYRLELCPRKSLTVWRWPHGAEKYERHEITRGKNKGQSRWRMTPHDSCVLWDVWGFFQGSFVKALRDWLPNDPDHEMIKREKGNRAIFDRRELDAIRRYTDAELRCLVAMMEKVRDAIRSLGLTITRWDGAGAIAGAFLKKNDIKQHMAESPPEVFEAARYAYSGGHIEACKIGYHNGKVYHYDINSAYPNQFRNLPSLSSGTWRSGGTDQPVPMGFTLVHVEYRFNPGLPFYPLFYRQSNGSILYPERGSGWYWYPEFAAAQKFVSAFGAIEFRVVAWWHLDTHGSNFSPFSWIEAAYAQRQEIVAETKRTGIPNGAEKTLKLGYNSCYGKSAQQVGAKLVDGEIQAPAYFQIEWAGFVTSGCRAQLMDAALEKPHAIISFATDGLFSTEPLSLYCPSEKELGAWEAKIYDGMVIVMPGVYWLHDGDKTEHYSRGFDKQTMEDDALAMQGWRQRKDNIDIPSTRMVTLGSALMSGDMWDMRGCWAQTTRSLKLNGYNSKRTGITYTRHAPHKGLVNTRPAELAEAYETPLSALMSEPYPISWLDLDLEQPEQETPNRVIDAGDASFYADTWAAMNA